MGGAVKHLRHVQEDLSLTFKELKDILISASSGELAECYEKFDGINLVFSFGSDGLRVARGKKDIISGGLTTDELREKFAKHTGACDAVISAFDILQRSLSMLSASEKQKIFSELTNWYSCEVIYPENANVINYDTNSIVFHGKPVFKRLGASVSVSANESGLSVLLGCVNKMQTAVATRNWKLLGPTIVNLKKINDKTVLDSVLLVLDECVDDDNETIGNYLEHITFMQAQSLNLSPTTTKYVVERCVYGSPSLTVIKSRVSMNTSKQISKFVNETYPTVYKRAIEPIEMSIHSIAIEVIKNLKSVLVIDNKKTTEALKKQVVDTLKSLENSDDTNIVHQIKKLGDIEKNVMSSIEGIVFSYKGEQFKLTGAFAPINQLLGIYRYNR